MAKIAGSGDFISSPSLAWLREQYRVAHRLPALTEASGPWFPPGPRRPIFAIMDLATARTARDAQVAQHASQFAEFATTRPTPARDEVIPDGVVIGALRSWDLSPVDRSSFDPAEPPGRPLPPDQPICTMQPNIVLLGDTPDVGESLAGQQGTWTGSGLRFSRQWFRGARPIAGATGAAYVLTPPDVGYTVTFMVTVMTSAGGAGIAMAAAVGPVRPASPRR
jgi:hypothetical protein